MALAQRLNELAIANSEGLLNDDEYRLLRQNLFEEHTAGPLPSSPSHQRKLPTSDVPTHKTAPKQSSLSFSTLLRRATGRWSSISSGKRTPDASRRPPPLDLRTTARSSTSMSSPSSSTTKISSISPSISSHVPGRYITSAIRDVFDEGPLSSAADLRAALANTEEECRKLTGAFNDLEANTLRRIRKRRARRLPMNTPASIDVLLAGGEWREHRLASPPSSPLGANSCSRDRLHSIHASPSAMLPPPSSSLKPKGPGLLSRSASHIGLRKLTTRSSKDTGFGVLGGAGLVSNRSKPGGQSLISSSSTLDSGFAAGFRNRTSQKHIGRDAHGPHSPDPSRGLNGELIHTAYGIDPLDDHDDDHDDGSESVADDIQTLEDVRRRRDDLVTRYTTRLDFLRAKLRSAEIQEKLQKR